MIVCADVRCWLGAIRPVILGWLVAIAWCMACALPCRGDESDDYLLQVRPVLAERCYACHGAWKQEGALRLDTVASMQHGGDSGSVLDTQTPAQSILLQRVRDPDPQHRMPPEGQPLSEAEIASIEAWIRAGAPAPAEDMPQKDPREHWAFRSPVRPALPWPPDPNVANPIDAWLSDKQRALGVQPLDSADRHTLLRRLFLDLLGLPPTPEQLEAFIADPSDDAYQRWVDWALSQPEYGERWGRHWMDVWRYSDWYGRRSVPDVMNSYPQIWRWRDWIVRSLQEDKGYDRMVMEMLAADEMVGDGQADPVATGFLVRNWYKWNYETWMKDNVEHTAKAFLGLTMNCAMCHDHKYDPITHEDYFRFRAFFEPLELRHDRVAGLPDPGPFKKYVYAESYGPIAAGAIRVFDEKLDAKTYMFRGGDARNRIEGRDPVEPSPPHALAGNAFTIAPVALPPEAYFPGLQPFVRREEQERAAAETASAQRQATAAVQALANAIASVKALDPATGDPSPTRWNEANANRSSEEHALALADWEHRVALAALTVAMSRERAVHARMAADDAQVGPREDAEARAKSAHQAETQCAYEVAQHACLIAERRCFVGEHALAVATRSSADAAALEAAQKEVSAAQQALTAARDALASAKEKRSVVATDYTPLSPVYPRQSTGRRLALAKWIVDPSNPLTARVAVNHVWMRHMGQPLVPTVENFGVQGKEPRHPELLDWLAVEFIESAWSMKHLHRIVLTSEAYRRASHGRGSEYQLGIERDRDNVTYWRAPIRRMEAEVVRDSAMACAGLLDQTFGGPEIETNLWVRSRRRSMYFTIHGEAKMPFLETMDGPNVNECYRRTTTILPQQALAMTNSELLVHCGRRLAARIEAEHTQAASIANASDGSPSDAPLDDTGFIHRAFQWVLGRPPSQAESAASAEFLASQTALLETVTPEQLGSASHQDVTPPSSDAKTRARENLAISLFSHNDFVTIR